MSLGYGPLPLVPGSPTQFRIAKNAVNVQIRNFSRYFVGVYFGSDPPSGSTTTTLAPGFHTVIAPGEQPVLPVVGNYATDPGLFPNGLTEFTGDVFLQPISIDANLVLTGASSQNYATLTMYLSGEGVPDSTAAPRVMDASNQQREISLPMTVVPWANGATNPTTPSDTDITDVGLPTVCINNNQANIYLYSLHATVVNIPAAGAINGIEVTFSIDVLSALAGTQLATFTIASGYIFLAQGATGALTQGNFDREYAIPRCIPLIWAGPTPGTALYRVRAHWANASKAGTPNIQVDGASSIDAVNVNNVPGPYGYNFPGVAAPTF